MLSLVEKVIFALAALATIAATFFAVKRLTGIIGSGHGKPDWKTAFKRLPKVLGRVSVFQPVFRFRPLPSIFDAFVGWGFGFYLLVNVVDVLRGYISGFEIPGMVGDVYRLLSDLLSAGVLVGAIFFSIRRFVFRPANLTARESTLLDPKARRGIKRDSAIVVGPGESAQGLPLRLHKKGSRKNLAQDTSGSGNLGTRAENYPLPWLTKLKVLRNSDLSWLSTVT